MRWTTEGSSPSMTSRTKTWGAPKGACRRDRSAVLVASSAALSLLVIPIRWGRGEALSRRYLEGIRKGWPADRACCPDLQVENTIMRSGLGRKGLAEAWTWRKVKLSRPHGETK